MSKEITIKGQTEIATTSHNDAMLSMIERLATDPNADIEKLERMLDMQERIFNKNAETAYNSAMSIAQNEIGPIVKNKENKFNNSRYADIDAIHDKAKPVWTKHGFSVSSTVYMAEKDGYVGIKTTVRHSGGHKEEYSNEWPLDGVGAQGKANKTAIQAIGSTATYARRYSEMMIFDIAIAEEDRDGAPVDVISFEQGLEIQNLIGEDKELSGKVLEYCECETIGSIPLNLYESVIKRLTATKKGK